MPIAMNGLIVVNWYKLVVKLEDTQITLVSYEAYGTKAWPLFSQMVVFHIGTQYTPI